MDKEYSFLSQNVDILEKQKEYDIIINENCLIKEDSKNVFEYLKEISAELSLDSKDKNNQVKFLYGQYQRIKHISKESVLASYVESRVNSKIDDNSSIIFPFGCNLSQKEATKNVFSNQISIIKGPPGTGKTQTILNIIANAIIRDKTVAVVSNNNSAILNVLEKMQKYELEFICSYLGNKENKDKFFSNQSKNYPEMKSWNKDKDILDKLKEDIIIYQEKIDEMLDKQNKYANLKVYLDDLRLEYKYFLDYAQDNHSRDAKLDEMKEKFVLKEKKNSENIMKLLIEYELEIKKKGKINFLYKMRNLFKYGVINFSIYKNDNTVIIDWLKELYYTLAIDETKQEIEMLEKKLEGFDFKSEMNKFSKISMDIVKYKLYEKFGQNENRKQFKREDLSKKTKEFLDEYPVILSTTHSIRTCINENYLFDYVVIDEASQVDVVTGSLAFSCAKNAVVVGDLKQLTNIVESETKKKTDDVFEKYNIPQAYKYTSNLLLSVDELYNDIPKVLLKEHYRCHPKIIGFCNKRFYDGNLVIHTSGEENDMPLRLYKTSKGSHARETFAYQTGKRGIYNQRQIDVIVEEIIPSLNLIQSIKSIGIVSPYKNNQVAKIREVINNSEIEVDTVHKYQGREKDSIILTTVANKVNEFIDNENLINVAVSRAVKQFDIIVSDDVYKDECSTISDLIKYIKYNNFHIEESKVYSIFDLLYKEYEKELEEVLNKNKNVSRYNSENLCNNLLEDILSKDEFILLGKQLNKPLREIIKDKSFLTDREAEFVKRSSHVDFLIFNKMDMSPILAIEVDGCAYHEANPQQLKKDKMKDEIFKKYNIPILRLKTNESFEKERILKKLTEIYLDKRKY